MTVTDTERVFDNTIGPKVPLPDFRETPDLERIDRLIAWAEVEYEKMLAGLKSEWDQGDWVHELWADPDGENDDFTVCGTACCMAGRVGLEDGVLINLTPDTIFTEERELLGGGRIIQQAPVARYARNVLGIVRDDWRIGDLFAGENKIGDLKRIRDNIAESVRQPRLWSEEEYQQGYDEDEL